MLVHGEARYAPFTHNKCFRGGARESCDCCWLSPCSGFGAQAYFVNIHVGCHLNLFIRPLCWDYTGPCFFKFTGAKLGSGLFGTVFSVREGRLSVGATLIARQLGIGPRCGLIRASPRTSPC